MIGNSDVVKTSFSRLLQAPRHDLQDTGPDRLYFFPRKDLDQDIEFQDKTKTRHDDIHLNTVF